MIIMNSPYEGKFKVSQQYKPGVHDGLDLVGIDSKEIHSCANAKVIHVGWENPNDHSQGFGYYVATKDIAAGADGVYKIRYYGHLTENSARVKVGDTVKTTDVLGVEGHTGYTVPAGACGEFYKDKMGKSSKELFAQFLIRIQHEIKAGFIAQFSKLKTVQGYTR